MAEPKTKPATKPASTAKHDLPTSVDGLVKEADKLRLELAGARRSHALQQLESPAKLRQLRARLARVLTVKRAKEQPDAKSEPNAK